jgi:hypothetical protein
MLNVERGQLRNAVGRDKVLFGMKGSTGNLWMPEFR